MTPVAALIDGFAHVSASRDETLTAGYPVPLAYVDIVLQTSGDGDAFVEVADARVHQAGVSGEKIFPCNQDSRIIRVVFKF